MNQFFVFLAGLARKFGGSVTTGVKPCDQNISPPHATVHLWYQQWHRCLAWLSRRLCTCTFSVRQVNALLCVQPPQIFQVPKCVFSRAAETVTMWLKRNFLTVLDHRRSNGTLVKPIGMSARWIVQHEIIFGDFVWVRWQKPFKKRKRGPEDTDRKSVV